MPIRIVNAGSGNVVAATVDIGDEGQLVGVDRDLRLLPGFIIVNGRVVANPIYDFGETLDGTTRTSLLNYPGPYEENPACWYVKWDDALHKFYVRINQVVYYQYNIGRGMEDWTVEILTKRCKEVIRINGNQFVYPFPGTAAWNELISKANIDESLIEITESDANAMPNTVNTVDSPDIGPYTFAICFNIKTKLYGVLFPERSQWAKIAFNLANPHIMEVSSLAQAHKLAYEQASKARTTTGCDDFRVWPRKNSNAYRKLEAAKDTLIADTPNNFGMGKSGDLKDIIVSIKTAPQSANTEILLTKLFKYKLYKKYGLNFIFHYSDQDINSLKIFFKRVTGVDYVNDLDDALSFIHPDNIIRVHHDRNNVEIFYTIRRSKLNLNEHVNCSRCNNVWAQGALNRIRTTDDGNRQYFCTTCTEAEGYRRCGLCGNGVYHRGEDACPSYEGMNLGQIHGYSLDVRAILPRMFHMPDDKLVNGNYLRYGVELEVINKELISLSRVANAVGNSLKHHALMKTDSSLRTDQGFEIVTVPATLEYHRKKLWSKFFNDKDSSGRSPAQLLKSWDTNVCGIHVHITRAAMTSMQLGKLICFYHEPGNSTFLSRIAGRTVGPRAVYCLTAKKKLYKDTAKDSGEHHGAIAISRRNAGKTAEVRIFRGNCSKHGVMRSLEFVDATVKWCGQNAATELTYKNFLEWFNKPTTRSQYPDLWKHLMELGYIKTKHKSFSLILDETGKKVKVQKETIDLIPENERIA